MNASLNPNRPAAAYGWPDVELGNQPPWSRQGEWVIRPMPESEAELANDSRWPAFFPSSVCHVTCGAGDDTALERIVGAAIVNRFPYVMAISVCRTALSQRHYVRAEFMRTLERSGEAVVQFFEPGPVFDAVARAVADLPDAENRQRIAATGRPTRCGQTVAVPVLADAYLAYETKLAQPRRDFAGETIYERPWRDVGSHRVYFLEITAIQLRADVAAGRSQIRWRSLPDWSRPDPATPGADAVAIGGRQVPRYQKGFTYDYRFPARDTRAFEGTYEAHGMSCLVLPPALRDGVEVDNDRARWPCFFPSSAGMITSREEDGRPNLMPCGSTTVISRQPLTIAVAIACAPINDRYRQRHTLAAIRRTRRFGCGVPFVDEQVVSAIQYAGNVSLVDDPDKIAHAGLHVAGDDPIPRLAELPVHFDCTVVEEVRLGTHVLILGRVTRIWVHASVGPGRPLQWSPSATVAPVDETP